MPAGFPPFILARGSVMRRFHALVPAILMLGVLHAESAQAQRPKSPRVQAGSCGTLNRSAVRQVLRGFGQTRLAWFRRQYSLTAVTPHSIRRLAGPAHKRECEQLDAYYAGSVYSRAPWVHTYFSAPGYTIASFIDTTTAQGALRRAGHFAVFSPTGQLVAKLSPK